jgi:hypothetical protein
MPATAVIPNTFWPNVKVRLLRRRSRRAARRSPRPGRGCRAGAARRRGDDSSVVRGVVAGPVDAGVEYGDAGVEYGEGAGDGVEYHESASGDGVAYGEGEGA